MSANALSVCLYCADQNRHRDRSRGITGYTYGLLSRLALMPDIELFAVVSKSSFEVPPGLKTVSLPFRTDGLAGRLAGDHLHPFFTRKISAQLWHYPKGFLPRASQVRAKRVGTIADVMLQRDADYHPESRSFLAFAYWIEMLKHSIRSFDLILTVSEFSKRGILEFCDRHHLKNPPIVVTYEGVEVDRSVETLPRIKEDYFIHLASPLPHKATGWLVQEWMELSALDGGIPRLMLVGDVDSRTADLLSRAKNITLSPPVERSQLEDLLARSKGLLLPSEIEGFGIPAVEAYLLKTPVAYVRGTAVEEILGGDAPGGFLHDHVSLERALHEILNVDAAQVEQRGAALRERYSWSHCVGRTVAAYREIL